MNSVVKKLIGEITELAYEITNKTKHDVFVRYYGHVNGIAIDININGYSEKNNDIGLLNLYINSDREAISKTETSQKKIKEVIGGKINE